MHNCVPHILFWIFGCPKYGTPFGVQPFMQPS